MKIPQLSVFLENRPSALLEPLQTLAAANINMAGISLADTEDFGILRILLKDWEPARAVLQGEGWAVTVSEMVAVDVDDHPGGLVRTLEVLAAAAVNIEYMYAFYLRHGGRVVLMFRFEDPDAAVAALAAAGIAMVTEQDLY